MRQNFTEPTKHKEQMKYAIETLERELEKLNTPSGRDFDDDEEDLVGAVIHFRKTTSIRLGIKLLKQMVENTKEINLTA